MIERLMISVDDGHPLDLRVLELLKKYNLTKYATFYIAPGNVEREVMTREDIKKVSEFVEIGGHTLSHEVLTRMGTHEQIAEITLGKNTLERIIGRKIHIFAPPRGWYDESVKKNVKACGFYEMRTMKQGSTKLEGIDPFEIPVSFHFYPKKEYVGEHALIDAFTDKLNVAQRAGEGFFGLSLHGWEVEKFDLWNELEEAFYRLSMVEKV